MDLGYKTLNNLTSKDFNIQKKAATLIINSKDVKAFKILSEKSEFIFDFIKDKVIKNLKDAVNQNNVSNLFDFLKIYSEDFKDFIIDSFIKFNSKEIEDKLFNLLNNGIDEEKTYALYFFLKNKNYNVLEFAKCNINSGFAPLKNVSIKHLKEKGEKEEFNNSIGILNSDKDDFEKLQAVEFLSIYNDKEGFYPIYNYLKKTGANEIVASNLLLIKSFSELIEENLNDEILTIYSSIIYNFPDSVSFNEIQYYNEDGIFDYLIESDDNFASLLILFLKERLQNSLNDESYALDFSGNTKKEAEKFLSALNLITDNFDKNSIINSSVQNENKTECLIGIELSNFDNLSAIENILDMTSDNEIILLGLDKLKKYNGLKNELVKKLVQKTENETVKLEIEKFYS